MFHSAFFIGKRQQLRNLIMKVLILLGVIAVAFASEQCGKNQHYSSCGTACPVTCENKDNQPQACILSCKAGCHCDAGYVLNAENECVRPNECPALSQECGINQHYSSCGTACPETCDNKDNNPEICILPCKAGCQCNAGYVLNAQNKCVRPNACPATAQRCGNNQHYSSCGSACPVTCENKDDQPQACILSCKAGCHCDAGYVLNAENECVLPNECPAISQECGKNQHYSSCGSACPETCDNKDNQPQGCILSCKAGCHCNAGYVLNAQKECVRPNACPAKSQMCGKNQHYSSCGSACPVTCDNKDDQPQPCPLMCEVGCHCDAGYVLNAEIECVRPNECPAKAQPVCGENERYNECGTSCPLTCGNYRNPPRFCNLMCNIGCECEQGYVRAPNGRCIKPFNCPQNATAVKSCLGTPETGMCKAYIPRFHYDIESGTCKQFIYGGCGGNGNNYETKEDCMGHCEGVQLKQSSDEVCNLPAETGVCRGFFPRYYFDRTTSQCIKFVYGGCGGNENNFESIEECQKSCVARSSIDICSLPAETGRCRGLFHRFFFNKKTGQCEGFIYGGCGGNLNNFERIEDCQNSCA